ncbi:MAG TPA: hypothetical protein VFH80_27825 [Solirubrobacteraceae bacterium]|nr:hypothetical protein [Solirubrobacteraceae bacterium]
MQVAQEQKRAIFRVEMTLQQVADRKQLEVVTLGRFGALREALQRTPQPPTSTKRCKCAIACDPEQPRFRIVDRVKLIAAAERLVEAVLQEILSQRSIADHLGEEAAETSLATAEQTLHSLPTKWRRWTVLRVVALRRRVELLGDVPHLRIQVPTKVQT